MLCDTNGGSLPFEVEAIVAAVTGHLGDTPIGVHLHDDTGCGVANALAGVRGGAVQVQGTINGYGERTGNCNLTTIIPNLTLKMGVSTLPAGRLERLTSVSHHIAELVNITLDPQAPYVGSSAFAHKAGLHVSRHRPPQGRLRARRSRGGRQRHPLRGVRAGGPVDLELKAAEIGLDLDGPALERGARRAQARSSTRGTTSRPPTARSSC